MKKIIPILFFLISLSASTQAQYHQLLERQGYFGGGLGLTWIDGEPHYSLTIFPELSFGNIGLGLNMTLDFTADGKIRSENFNTYSDYLSVIRYVRYGYKGDPVYARLGALDYATLGHGTIMNMYNNSPSFDNRKIGLAFDMDFVQFGFETVYAQFAEDGVAGGRAYVRPLQFTTARSIPIISAFEVGFTLVSDFHKYADVTGVRQLDEEEFEPVKNGALTIWGIDFGLPVINTKLVNTTLYFDYNNIVDYGSGTAGGVIVTLQGLGLFNVRAKLERRFSNDNYLPAYFNPLYEVERFSFNPATGSFRSKANALEETEDIGGGYYGELLVSLINTFYVTGSYQRVDNVPNNGILHLGTEINKEGLPFVLKAGYDKINIVDEQDIFTLDDRSYLFTEAGYKPNKYILISLIHRWTFEPVRDADDNVIDYEPQRRIEPRVSLIYPFDF